MIVERVIKQRGAAVAAWIVLLASETLAQIALKAGGQSLSRTPFGTGWLATAATTPWVLVGVMGYIGGFLSWMFILDRIPLSLGFPLTAIVMLMVALASCLVFGETLTVWRLSGIGLIIAGVLMVGGGET